MTSTNDEKDVKSNQTSGQKGKTYFIELYKSLDARLSGDCDLHERTRHLCDAWRRIHSLCQHSAPSTHPHLLSWLQRHTARTVLQTEWHKSERKDDIHKLLEEAIDDYIQESRTATSARDGISPAWEIQLLQRGEWFQRILGNPWGHPTLRVLLDSEGQPPSDTEVLEWLKEERCVMFVTRLRQLAADKRCVDLALLLVSAVMDRVRASEKLTPDAVEEAKDKPDLENAEPTFADVLKAEAGFTVDVWELLTDIEFVLLHKRDKRARCIELAKQTQLRDGYQLVERLQSRLDTSPRDKKLWKNAKEVAILIAQVIIARCMVVPACAGAARTALYCCARSLARLLPPPRLPPAAAALAAPAATARHLHTLAAAVDAQSTADTKPFVCELYVRAITAGMNELERLKLKTEKAAEARLGEQTLAAWLTQLGALLGASTRMRCECALTAFSLHPSAAMYDRIRAAPALDAPDIVEPKQEQATSEFGSWASDSRSQTNFVKTSETINMKHTQHQANVLSTAILTEGEALGLSPELCQDISVLLSGPRLKTLSWDMDREVLLEKCRTYMERTHGGTRALTTELKYLNLDPKDFDHLPEEEEDDTDIYYGIEKGYEHLVEQYHEPEEIWQDADDLERTASANSSDMESVVTPRIRRKKKSKRIPIDSDEDLDPLSSVAEAKRTEKKKERPLSKERSKERVPAKAKTKTPKDPLATDPLADVTTVEIKKEVSKEKKNRGRKKKDKKLTSESKPTSLSSLIGMKISTIEDKTDEPKINPLSITDSDYDSQGKSSINSLNSEGNDPDVLFDGLFSMDELKSPDRNTDKIGLMKNNELRLTNGSVTINSPLKKVHNTNVEHSTNSTTNVLNNNLPTPHTDLKQQSISEVEGTEKLRTVTDDVKKSITRLIHFRRQKALNEQRVLNMSPPIANSPTKPHNNETSAAKMPNAITKPQIPLHTQISPKAVDVPEIPKVYINKRQSEQLAELKEEVNTMLNNQNYITQRPVIRYAEKTNVNIQSSSSKVHSPSTPEIPQHGYLVQNKLHPKPMSRVNEIKSRKSQSITNIKIRDTPNQNSFHDFLQELQKSINAGAGVDQSNIGNVHIKKEIRPISRVEPVSPVTIKAEPKTSPQCAKQSVQQKKMENALNTFSRLSYMHKTNKSDLKLKHIEAIIENQDKVIRNQQALSNIDHTIQEQKHAKYKYLHTNDLVISRVNKSMSKSNESSQLPKTVPKPVGASSTSISGEHPLISNMLQRNETSTQKTSIKYENPTKIVQKNVEQPRDSTTSAPNRFSALSEKDQNDLLLLLRQQRKQNANLPRCDNKSNYNIQSAPYSSTNIIHPNIYSPIPCQQPTNKILDAPSTSVPACNTNSLPNTTIKIPHAIPSVVDVKSSHEKPVIVGPPVNKSEFSCTNNADPSPIKSQKTEVISENVAKIAANKQTDWESVMNALLSHKTPSRGPNALEMALNKEEFNKNYADSILRAHRIMTPNSPEDLMKPSIVKEQTKVRTSNPNINAVATPATINNPTAIRRNTKSIIKDMKYKIVDSIRQSQTTGTKHSNKPSESPHSNPNLIRPAKPDTLKRQRPLDNKRPTQTDYPKRSSGTHKKQFTCALPKADDPFISGIPNSDYDLLEELMDDDLRQEIGELSDDETYRAPDPVHKESQNFIASKDKRPAIQQDKCVVTTPGTTSRQQTIIKPVQIMKPNNPVRAIDTPIHVQRTSGFVDKHTELNTTDHKMKEVPSNVIVSPNRVNNVSYNINRQVNQTEQAFATMPQQTALKNVVLIGSDIVYQPYSIQTQIPITSLASNTFVTYNNQANMALYQTTQFAAPAVNPLIIGNATTMPMSGPIDSIQTTTVPKSSEIMNNIDKQEKIIEPEINQNQIVETKSEPSTPVAGDISQHKIPIHHQPRTDAVKSEKDFCEITKSCERKVLSEVQEKFSLSEKTDVIMTRSRKQSLNQEVKKEVSKDQERLKKKRLAILNRNIYHHSDNKPIPLTYVPLKPSREMDHEQQMNRNTTTAVDCQSGNYSSRKTDTLTDSIAQTLHEPNQDKIMASASSVDTPENCKENKSDSSQCRRILLRSSNRLSKVKTSDVTPSDTLSTKSKVRLKSHTTEGTEKIEEKCNDNISADIPDQNIVLHKKRLKKKKIVKLKGKVKKTDVNVKYIPDNAKRNLRAKIPKSSSVSETSFSQLPEEVDIEEQLMGSKIQKNVLPLEPSNNSQIPDEGRTVLENEANCQVVCNIPLINDHPPNTSNNESNISKEKQDLSCRDSHEAQNKVDVVNQITQAAEMAESSNLTEDLQIKDFAVNKTNSSDIEIKKTPPSGLVCAPGNSDTPQFDDKNNTEKDKTGPKSKDVIQDTFSGMNIINKSIVEPDNTKSKEDKTEKDVLNSNHIIQDANKNQAESSAVKVCDIKSIPQSYKDSIIIENLPNKSTDLNPNKKCVRIKLPSGRVFKATVHGNMNVNFDTLFSDPTIKDILLSNLTDRKRYTLNIKQVATTNNNDVQARIQEVKLHAAVSTFRKMETINLLTDDEDEEPCQQFKTDQGNYKVNLNRDDFTKHQKRFDQKCFVKLKRQNLQQYVNNNSKYMHGRKNKMTKSNTCDLHINVASQNLVTSDELPSVVPPTLNTHNLDNAIKTSSITKNKQLVTTKSTSADLDVIEIEDSSNDSFKPEGSSSQILNSVHEKITELKDLLLKDLGIADLRNNVIPAEMEVLTVDTLELDSNEISHAKDLQPEGIKAIPIEKEVISADELELGTIETRHGNDLGEDTIPIETEAIIPDKLELDNNKICHGKTLGDDTIPVEKDEIASDKLELDCNKICHGQTLGEDIIPVEKEAVTADTLELNCNKICHGKDLGEDAIPVEKEVTALDKLTLDSNKCNNEKDLAIGGLGEDVVSVEKEVISVEKLQLDSDKINIEKYRRKQSLREDVVSVEKVFSLPENDSNKISKVTDSGIPGLGKDVISVETEITSAEIYTLDSNKISHDLIASLDENVITVEKVVVPPALLPLAGNTSSDDIIDLTDEPINDKSPTESSLPELQLPNCCIQLMRCDGLVKKYEQQNLIINKKCYVKLIRCDQNCVKNNVEEGEFPDNVDNIIRDNISDYTHEEPLSRSGSFSILNDFPVFDIGLAEAGEPGRCSSPVINVYEAIAVLNNSFTKANKLGEFSVINICKSEWVMTKCELQSLAKRKKYKNYRMATTKDYLNERICTKSDDIFNAPSLLTILANYFQVNNDIMDKLKPIHSVIKNRSCRLKRKSTNLETGEKNKLCKIIKSEKLKNRTYVSESTDSNSTVNKLDIKENSFICDNIYQNNASKQSIMADVHMESLEGDDVLQTDQNNTKNNVKEIEGEAIEHIDEKLRNPILSNDFVNEDLQESHPGDKDIVIEINKTNSCCEENNSHMSVPNTALHQNFAVITNKINYGNCVNIENLIEGKDKMQIISNGGYNKTENYHENSNVENETLTTKDNLPLVGDGGITLTTNSDKLAEDCTVLADALSDDEIGSYTVTGEASLLASSEQNNIAVKDNIEVTSITDTDSDDSKNCELKIETPSSKEDVVLLDEKERQVATNIKQTISSEMSVAQVLLDINDIDNCAAINETSWEQNNIHIKNPIEFITAIDNDREQNKLNAIKIENLTSKEVILRSLDDISTTNIDKTQFGRIEMPVASTSSGNNEISNRITAEECNSEDVIINEVQIETSTTVEDTVLLVENDSPSDKIIDRPTFECTAITIAATSIDNINIRNVVTPNKCISEQHNIQKITNPIDVSAAIDINEDNLTVSDYIEIASCGIDDQNTEYVDNEIVICTNESSVESYEELFERVDEDRIEINGRGVNDSYHNVMAVEEINDDKTISNIIVTPIILDHEYTMSTVIKINQHSEAAEGYSNQNTCKEITNFPTESGSNLEIREDNEIISGGREKVLVTSHTNEIYSDASLLWSGKEIESDITNSGGKREEKELTIKSDTHVESRKENYQNDSTEIENIQDKSDGSDQTSNEVESKLLMQSTLHDSGILLKGIEYEDPEIGTCYVFPLVTSISECSECDSDANNIEEVIQYRDDDSNSEELKLNLPKITYLKEHTKTDIDFNALNERKSRRGLKRKIELTDTKIYEKKYRKGKGIDYPKITFAAMRDTAYSKQFKCLFDYFSSIKFSYSLPFHKDNINVQKVLSDWPIQSNCSKVFQNENEVDENLFRDVETAVVPIIPDPKEQTLAEEIAAEYKETDFSSSNINETNFNMGFGEGSDRVIQNLEGGDDISKFSAATLSDVKHSQPLLLSESSKFASNTTKDEIEMLQRHLTYMQLRDRVRSFFSKTKVELSHDWMKDKDCDRYDTSTFPFGLNLPEFIDPCPVEAIVQVVQVGQLPVSAAAQNPVTCDPRVTQVSDVSPSQYSAENSPNGDQQSAIKTEYTELTTADFSLPIMQDYAPHNQSMPMESQEASNMAGPDENIPIETEINSVVKIELMEELPEENPELNENVENNNIDYSFPNVNTNDNNSISDNNSNIDSIFHSAEKQNNISVEFHQEKQKNGSSEKTDQIAHAMNAAGITTTEETITNNRAQALVNLLSQKNTYPKPTSINAMALQQALAQILPPPLNQTNINENNQQTPQVLHIVQSKNGSGNHITLVDNTQQSVISTSNSTPVLHIVQNKGNATGSASNGTPTSQTNTFSGLSLVDAGLQPGGNQLLHIVNTGNQKNNSAGQLLKRVNLLTNLTNVQGSNDQKMVQFVCKSADGKAIQLNAPHQRSMVLRLQPIETPTVQAAPSKPIDSQERSPTPNAASTVANKETLTPQEIKSRSVYEENYAKFIQNSSNKTTILEKATSLPKFNQAFGKQVYQDGNQKQNEINNSNSLLASVNNNNDTGDCQSTDNAISLEHISQLSSPPLLLRKSSAQTSQAQTNLVQQIKQSIAPMNLQTMHGGVIYTRQIPVNIGGGQTINLITVPSTELIDDSTPKQHSDVKFVNQGEAEPSIIKIVPQTSSNVDVSSEENNTHMGVSNENSHTPQPQPVLTQMRIKLPMLSKTPQMVSGARVVRPSFFQIQRNVIGGGNQQVYQQLVLTAAPPLGQQTIRLPQTQTSRQIKVPTESQSSTESQMSSSTLEQLREFDLVLEQVKERSTVQPNGNSSNNAFSKLHTTSTDTTDGVAPATASSTTAAEITQQILYSISNNQPLNVAYVNRKATVTATTTSTYVRSPDSSGIVDSPTSSTHIQIPHTVTSDTSTSETPAQSKPTKVKSKPRPKASSNPPNTFKLTVPPKTSAQKPLEDEQTTQRILYILAEYKEQVENSPDKDKPAPRRRSNPPSNPSGSSKRKKSSSSSRRPGGRDMSPVHGEDTCRTMGSEDSSCGTSQGDCNESCIDSHSPQDSPRKVVRKLTFENETPPTQPRPQPQRNVIVADGQTITVARGTTGKPATAVLMPANYILPVSMVKGGQQIAIVTNRGPKLLTVGGGEGGTTNALLLQRLINPAGLKPVLARPGVRHVRLPTAALHNLQAFNLAAATVPPPDSTASPVPAPNPPELVDTRANSSPWTDRESDVKPERGSSPDGSEPWNLPSSADPHDYTYEEPARVDNMDRTVLDSISDRYSPDMDAQRIFDKMFDVDTKKSYMVDSPRCGYDIDASDCDDKGYHQVVHKKDGSSHRQHRVTHVSAAALRHKFAILEHELRLQKSLSEECEDLGVDSPSASELFPEAELLFAASPAHDHTQDHAHHSHTPQPTFLNQSGIPQPDIDDQIATDQLLTRDDRTDLNLGLEDVGVVTVSEDGMQATIALDQEEFARSHPNTTFHSEPTDDGVVHPFTISGIKSRHIASTIFHSNRPPGTVLMSAPQTTVISQATAESSSHQVKFDIDNMINSLPGSHANTINLSSVLVKEDGLTRFDNILNDSRELHLSNTASAIVHSAGNAAQVIRRVCYDDDKRDTRFLIDEPEGLIAGDDAKMVAEDSSRDATLESMVDVDDDRSSPERHTELFWETNSERSESRRPLDFSSDSDKCCKSPFDETNSTDSSGAGAHMRLDTVIKEARGIERFGSGDGSSADDTHPPLRTYPPKRSYHALEGSVERSLSGKTRAGERAAGALEGRRRASGRGVVKRGCHCCNGSPAPPRPKKPRQRKPTLDFTTHN